MFKVWSKDKLNKKFVVVENVAEIVSKGIKAILFIFVYNMSAWRDRMLHATSESQRATSDLVDDIQIFKASLSFGDGLCLHILFV